MCTYFPVFYIHLLGGRGYKGRDNIENEESEKQSRPSGPATLFDFLETKIKPEKEERGKQTISKKIFYMVISICPEILLFTQCFQTQKKSQEVTNRYKVITQPTDQMTTGHTITEENHQHIRILLLDQEEHIRILLLGQEEMTTELMEGDLNSEKTTDLNGIVDKITILTGPPKIMIEGNPTLTVKKDKGSVGTEIDMTVTGGETGGNKGNHTKVAATKKGTGRINKTGEITQIGTTKVVIDLKVGIKTESKEGNRTMTKTDLGQKCLAAVQNKIYQIRMQEIHRRPRIPTIQGTSFPSLPLHCHNITLMFLHLHFLSR